MRRNSLSSKGRSPDNKVARLRRRLSLYASAFAITVALAIGIGLVYGNGDIGSAEARFTLGLNLTASAIFALVFATFASWVLDRNQRENIEEVLQREAREILTRVGTLKPKYLPIAEFPASHTFGEAFNHALMASLNGNWSGADGGLSHDQSGD
jgi:hypothetical protein